MNASGSQDLHQFMQYGSNNYPSNTPSQYNNDVQHNVYSNLQVKWSINC